MRLADTERRIVALSNGGYLPEQVVKTTYRKDIHASNPNRPDL